MTLTRQSSIDTPAAVVAVWQRAYARRLLVTDLIVILFSVYASQYIRFGTSGATLRIPGDQDDVYELSYALVSAILALGWLLSLELFATRDRTIVGAGTTEYKRIADATIRVFAVLAIAAFLLQSEVGRGYLLVAFPLGLSLLLLGRWVWRKWLIRRRASGAYSHRAILMGERQKSVHVARQMARDGSSGIVIVGAITERGMGESDLAPGIPVLGNYASLAAVLDEARADTVVFTGADTIDPREMREIGWELEATSTNLIVAPALTDVAGPRIHARPVAGLPLIQVDYPEFEGRKYALKRAFDLVISFLALVLLSPLFLVITLLVRRDSPGPALFTQERVGLNGKRFHMLKFRSMVVDAETQLPTLLDQHRRQRRALQAEVRPARHPDRASAAATQPRRAAAARQRAARRHVARRPAAAARQRGRTVRRLGTSATARKPGHDRPLADAAAAPTSPGTTACASTCTTSRTGR